MLEKIAYVRPLGQPSCGDYPVHVNNLACGEWPKNRHRLAALAPQSSDEQDFRVQFTLIWVGLYAKFTTKSAKP